MECVVTRTNDGLYHHGVKGMKWGVRRYQNADGTLTPAGQKKYGNSEVGRAKLAVKVAKKDYSTAYNKAHNRAVAAYSPVKKHRQANDARWEDAANKTEALRKAKDDYKQAKKNDKVAQQTKTKEAIKEYKKKWDDAESASNAADEQWSVVKEKRAKLGKTAITRMINAAKNNSDDAKDYTKAYDKWDRAANVAGEKWNEVSEAYQATGRNRVERIINNIRYS